MMLIYKYVSETDGKHSLVAICQRFYDQTSFQIRNTLPKEGTQPDFVTIIGLFRQLKILAR